MATKRIPYLFFVLCLLFSLPSMAAAGPQPPQPGEMGSGLAAAQALAPDAILPAVTFTGRVSWSVDGLGSNDPNGGIIQVEKPAGATVKSAYLAAATIFSGGTIADGAIQIDGTGVNWDSVIPSAISSYNHWSDVTALVKPEIDAAPAGRVDFLVTEANTGVIDGEILAVIFDDPNQTTNNTIVLMFGAQNTGGDTFAIGLAEPLDLADPNLMLILSLGISYGYQSSANAGQYSLIDVNGQRLTSSAGGQDDAGYMGPNGTLLTVGGLDDSITNPPDPYSGTQGSPPYRYDDELYDLKPFVQTGDVSIQVDTLNPSTDDNIFFAGLFLASAQAVVNEGILLSPTEATNPVGMAHAVTAKVQDDRGQPVQGTQVTFSVLAGPNAGASGMCSVNVDCTTDAGGQVSFTYTGTGGPGTDQIQACFLPHNAQVPVCSQVVTKTWIGRPQSRIYGWAFLDANADGWREHPVDTSAGVANVKLILTRDGVEVATALSTPEAGWYDFGLQDPGNYCVEMLTPAGYVPTSPTKVCFALGADDQVVNFGLEPARASIGDLVFFDTNINGAHDADESGISNVTVALWSATGGAPVAIIANTTTGPDGAYLFENVVPGEYFVQVTDDNGEMAGLSLTTAGNPLGPITVVHLQAYLDADFGYNLVCPPTRGAVSGRVWLDVNADGVQDAGEPGLSDVTVYIQPLGHLATRVTTTNAYGNFYACVRPGSYLVAPETDVSPLSDLVPITTEFYLPVTIKPGLGFHTAFFGYQ